MAPEHSPLLPPEVARACTGRQSRLRALLGTLGVDALLVSNPIDIRYLTGFNGDDSVLLVDGAAAVIISDSRYDEYLDPWRAVDGIEIVMGIRHRLQDALADLVGRRGCSRLGFQGEIVSVQGRDALAAALAGTTLVATADVLVTQRRRKDEVEIAAIERALRFQETALSAALPHLEIGMTERAFAARIEFEMKSRGAEGSSFEPIVATGANSSVIHHTTGPTPIAPGTLLIDWGAKADSYCGDLTRTFALGEMPSAIRDAYDIVLEAQLAAIDACAPGRTCAEIDAVARTIITRAGHGEHFGHGLGHGLGLEVHETPYFNDLETDTRLEPGMVMTVEPGIYLPGVGGVRIEDDVVITETGHRVLSALPKGPETTVLEPGEEREGIHLMIDIRKLKELVRLMVANELTELDLRDSEEQVTLRRHSAVAAAPVAVAPPPAAAAPPAAAPAPAAGGETAAATDEEAGLLRIESPMVGTYYSAADPDSAPFASVGTSVSPDSTVCILEAMKIFNEIKAECSGTIAKVLVANGESVEFGQPLFLVKPG